VNPELRVWASDFSDNAVSILKVLRVTPRFTR